MTPYQQHVAKWRDCQRCPLYDSRRKVVLCRGSIPCDVLFLGEAPGISEDVLGIPFVGPAGKLLDDIIRDAWEGCELTRAFTNVIACIPLEDGSKISTPPDESVKACSPRLKEIIGLCKPRLVVCVGTVASKCINQQRVNLGLGNTPLIDIVHPAAILRANIAQRGLMKQKAAVILGEALFDLTV